MTPLAAYLAKQLVSRPRERKHIWRHEHNSKMLRDALTEIHCFEITQCINLALELAGRLREQGDISADRANVFYETYAFLPAPKTWIEWIHGSGHRIAVLFEEAKEADSSGATLFCKELASPMGVISNVSGDYFDYGGERYLPKYLEYGGNKMFSYLLAFAHTMLVLINSPKIIGRRQIMPNAGLERRLVKGFGVGKFPLHAWTEIILQVNKPPEIDDGEPHEAHLTGRRALHFCRKHIRIRNGRLEYVRAHWRGDPALGIKQSRYTVQP